MEYIVIVLLIIFGLLAFDYYMKKKAKEAKEDLSIRLLEKVNDDFLREDLNSLKV